MLCRLEKAKAGPSTASTEAEPTCAKIYYASRTHSQLSQVLHELQKLNISLSPSSVISLHAKGKEKEQQPSHNQPSKRARSPADDEEEAGQSTVDIRTVSLGSRKQLCVNEELKAKSTDLDEACRQRLGGR